MTPLDLLPIFACGLVSGIAIGVLIIREVIINNPTGAMLYGRLEKLRREKIVAKSRLWKLMRKEME